MTFSSFLTSVERRGFLSWRSFLYDKIYKNFVNLLFERLKLPLEHFLKISSLKIILRFLTPRFQNATFFSKYLVRRLLRHYLPHMSWFLVSIQF